MHSDQLPPITEELGKLLRTAQGRDLALTSAAIGDALAQLGYANVNDRRIRELMATEYDAICLSAGGIILAEGGRGFWVSGKTEEIEDRAILLASLVRAARVKLKAFVKQVRAQGLGATLPTQAVEEAA